MRLNIEDVGVTRETYTFSGRYGIDNLKDICYESEDQGVQRLRSKRHRCYVKRAKRQGESEEQGD